jgi:CubicO group peptidase (beta-lactamase class C family)
MTRIVKGNHLVPRAGLALIHFLAVMGLLLTACAAPTPGPTAETVIEVTSMPAPPPTRGVPEKASLPTDEIDRLMNRVVEQAPLAGIALGIQSANDAYTQAYGLADIPAGTAVTTQTVFQIASLTKAVTAAAILRLSDEGKLGLDDPISRFLPGVPEPARDIRVRHLLNHTSGLPDPSIDAAEESLPEDFSTAQAVEQYFSTVEELDFEPGESWSYNNVGYFLLGAIIEQVSGMQYDEYFERTFFEPLGLHSISECPSQSGLLATGYHAANAEFEMARPSNLRLAGAAGALCSNVGDLLRWQEALTHGEVLRPELWEKMITPEELANGRLLDYGFGVSVQQGEHGPAIMHEGATAGFNSFFIYYPELDLNIVLLTNTDGFDSHLRAISSLVASKLLRAQ